MPQSAFSASIAIVVAQNYGDGKMERANKAVWYAVGVCTAIEAVFLGIRLLFPRFMPSMLSNDAAVMEPTGLYMKAYSIDGVLTAISFNLSHCSTAAKKRPSA